MTAQQFDDLTRAFGANTSRRRVLKLLLAGVASGALGRFGHSPASAQIEPECVGHGFSCDVTPCCEDVVCTPETGAGTVPVCCPPDSDYFCTPRGCCLQPCPDGFERDLDNCDCVSTCETQLQTLRDCMETEILEIGGYSSLPPDIASVLDSFFASLLNYCDSVSSGGRGAGRAFGRALAGMSRDANGQRVRVTPQIFSLIRRAAAACLGAQPFHVGRVRGQCYAAPIVQFCDPPCGPCETCSIDNVCVSDCDAGETCQDGSCVPGCASTGDCDAANCEACVNSQCVSQCGTGETCEGGSCVSSSGCLSDGDCNANNCETCVSGQCVSQCAGTCCPADASGCCATGTTCLPSGCCPDASVCPDGVTCRPAGACCPTETPCQGGCCPPEFGLCCGSVCCKPEGHCCPAGDCAPPDATCCVGGGYCENNGVCCPTGCCPSGTSCCTVNGQPSCC